MTTIDLRTDVHHLVDTINDIDILRIVRDFLHKTNEVSESWETLPSKVKQDLTIALEEAARGEAVNHEEVMKQMRSKYYKP